MIQPKTVVILGGGTGGLVTANRLKNRVDHKAKVVLIDRSPTHIYAPSFLDLMLGKRQPTEIQRPLARLEVRGIEFVNEEVIKIDSQNRVVETQSRHCQADYLVVSLGAELAPERVPGLLQSGYNLYELKGVERLRDGLKNFSGGKVAILVSSLPFKCPAAPYEAAFLLDEYFQKKGMRNKVEISVFTPEALPMPAAGRENGAAVRAMLEAREIKFNPETKLGSVDPDKKELVFEEGGSVSFDFLVYVPPHQGPRVVRESGIGSESGWIPVDRRTLKTKYENIFAIGDNAAITLVSGKSLPKAGVFAHFEAEVVAENISSEINGRSGEREYNGRGFCFLESGFGKAGFASGNFYAEPVPAVKLRRPSRLWHTGKSLFEKYWLWKWF